MTQIEQTRLFRMKKLIIIFIAFVATISLQSQSWTNPLTLSGEWASYGIGDPYIMKYRGTYYLYCTTKDNNIGIKCWSSKDLVNWSGPYDCSSDAITKTAYAPEVDYWNGTFYMYTSPAGNGHYVLTSTSPTGPFTVATTNLGKTIDGSIFINDDGNWYFYHASGNGILGCAMPSPTTIGSDINVSACMNNNWTEAPCVIKRNGIYYLLYSGNHFLSKGYRIDYAKNSTGPISTYTVQAAQNPILINGEGTVTALGHGTAFIGPDLDTYYFCYHNLASSTGPIRHLNIDRIAWNGDKLLMLGPTIWAQQAPQLPDMYDYFTRTDIGSNWTMPNGGNWSILNQDYMVQTQSGTGADTIYKCIHYQPTTSNYTAEFNLKEEQRDNNTAGSGAVFGYIDEDNYGVALLHSYSNKLEVNFKIDGIWGTSKLYSLPTGYTYTVWHNLRIEKSSNTYKFFVDGMLKSTTTSNLGAGKIGYITLNSHADFGFIAFSNKVNGSGIFDTYKPIPGKIQAVHYNNGGEGVGYQDLSAGNSFGKYIRNDSVDISDCTDGGFAITDNQSGEWYKYNTNVKIAGTYNIGLRYAAAVAGGQIRIWQGDTDLTGVVDIPATGGATTWRTLTIKGLNMIRGQQTIRVEIMNGGFNFYEMNFVSAENSQTTISDTFDSTFATGWYYTDGTWVIESGEASVTSSGKRAIGNTGWTDYTVQTDITYYDVINGGLILRVNNPALGGAGSDPILGTDFYQGYFVSLSASSVILGKQNYNWTQLASIAGNYVINKKYILKVVVAGSNIKVYVDDMLIPKIDYTDATPIISGKVGLRAYNAHIHFDNFIVTTGTGSSTKVELPTSNEKIELFPNPASDQLTIRDIANYTDIKIYNIDGKNIFNKKLTENTCLINTSTFVKGLYMLKISNISGNYVTRKFVKD